MLYSSKGFHSKTISRDHIKAKYALSVGSNDGFPVPRTTQVPIPPESTYFFFNEIT